MNIIVTGGAGYIGSYVCKELLDRGHKVWIIDDLRTGHLKNIDLERISGFFYNGAQRYFPETRFSEFDHKIHFPDSDPPRDFSLEAAISSTILEWTFQDVEEDQPVDAIIHLAGLTSVVEAEKDPNPYYYNNLSQSIAIAAVASRAGIKKIVFASTAAVYDEYTEIPSGNNTYGITKALAEQALEDICLKTDTKYCALRLFNVAGCLPGMPTKETGFIRKVAIGAVTGKMPELRCRTNEDGTKTYPARSWIHVADVAESFTNAVEGEIFDTLGAGASYDIGSAGLRSTYEVVSLATRLYPRGFAWPTSNLANGEVLESKTPNFSKTKFVLKKSPYTLSVIVMTELYNAFVDSNERIPDHLEKEVQGLVEFRKQQTLSHQSPQIEPREQDKPCE